MTEKAGFGLWNSGDEIVREGRLGIGSDGLFARVKLFKTGLEYEVLDIGGSVNFLPMLQTSIVLLGEKTSFSITTEKVRIEFLASSISEKGEWIASIRSVVSGSPRDRSSLRLLNKPLTSASSSPSSLALSTTESFSPPHYDSIVSETESRLIDEKHVQQQQHKTGTSLSAAVAAAAASPVASEGSKKANTNTNTSRKSVYEAEVEVKISNKIKMGYYRMPNARPARFCYVPASLMQSGSFNIDDMFGALGLPTPNLIFESNTAGDVDTWNLKLPAYKTNLVGQTHPDMENGILNPNLRHYQGVVRENCKRLLRGTAAACTQAGAIFRVFGTFYPDEPVDYVSEWITECSSVPLLAIEPIEAFAPEIIKSLLENAHNYNSSASNEDEDEVILLF